MPNEATKTRRHKGQISYGSISNLEFKKGKSRVSIDDCASGQRLQIQVKKRAKKLHGVFKEMQEIGMPLVVHRPQGKRSRRISYFLSFAKVVESSVEFTTEIEVQFTGTSAYRYFVSKANPFIDQIRDKINQSQRFGIEYWVVLYNDGSDDVEIVDVLFKTESIECCRKHPFKPEFDEDAARPISINKTQKLFRKLARKSTRPNSGPIKGIPFRFVSDGCEHRSHEMCRRLLKRRVFPMKVWAFNLGNPFVFKTKDHPNCEVKWSFHTAPAVLTKNGYYVIDPSTAKRAIPVKEWYDQIKNRGAKLYFTSHHVHRMLPHLCLFESDPEYKRANFRLRINRINLRLLSLWLGPLPFKHCKNST